MSIDSVSKNDLNHHLSRRVMDQLDVLVVGCGIFGVNTALELRARNVARVAILEPGPVPQEHAASTDISKIIRMDYGTDLLYTEMMVRMSDTALPDV
jgi:glycine/D-amino acid oxidase-like deaminating enzyme